MCNYFFLRVCTHRIIVSLYDALMMLYKVRIMADKNRNSHRKEKKCFQAYLQKDEQKLVEQVKRKKQVATDRELLLLLCTEENLKAK